MVTILKYLISEQGAPQFHFALGPTNYVASCSDMNVWVPQISYVEMLMPNVMVLGGGALRGASVRRVEPF